MRVALVQLSSTRNVEENLSACASYADQAREAGAEWILFPENAPFLGRDREKLPFAEDLQGPQISHFRSLAKSLQAWITVGSFAEISPDPTRTFNTQVHIGPEGVIRAAYRKIHLFDVSVDESVNFCESESVFPGEEIVDTRVLTSQGRSISVGLTICYDLRFPDLYQILRSRGAEVLTVPSAFTLQTGRAHWHALLQARAIENQAYVLAPNQWGNHYGNRHSFGQSVIYDPWGQRIACASDRPGFIVADLDFDYVDEIRRAMPVLDHRKIRTSSSEG